MKIVEETQVLVVDDYATMRRIITTMLRQFGVVNVDHAQNGAEALERMSRTSYDVILCDWCMETMSGEEFLRAARSSHPSTPVVIISAHGSQPIMEKARLLGAKSFLPKPFSVEALRTAVNDVCSLNIQSAATGRKAGLTEKLSGLLGAGSVRDPRRA